MKFLCLLLCVSFATQAHANTNEEHARSLRKCLDSRESELRLATKILENNATTSEAASRAIENWMKQKNALRVFMSYAIAGAMAGDNDKYNPEKIFSARQKATAYINRQAGITNLETSLIYATSDNAYAQTFTSSYETFLIYGDKANASGDVAHILSTIKSSEESVQTLDEEVKKYGLSLPSIRTCSAEAASLN